MVTNNTIILIRPDYGDDIDRAYWHVNTPLGLGYLAAYLEQYGYKVYILDLALRVVKEEDVIEFIRRKNPLFVGLTALTLFYNQLRRYSCLFREKIPDLKIVLGGIHVSSLPEVSLEECNADFIVIGEGETPTLQLANALRDGDPDVSKIKGLVYRFEEKDGSGKVHFINTGPGEIIKDLDTLPFPAWHKMNPNIYPRLPQATLLKYIKFASITSTRGCPYACTFCASCRFWRQRIRFRSPKNVVDEIQFLHEKYGIREIHFWDDNLTLKRDHIIGICKEIIRRGLNHMAFSTPNGVKIDTLDETVLKWMKAAGFYYLTMAIESGSPRILKRIKKMVNLRKAARVIYLARKLGYYMNSYIIIGLPGDTQETVNKTIRYAKSVPVHFTNFFQLKQLPGSELFDDWAKGKDFLNYDWHLFGNYLQEGVDSVCELTSEEINNAMHQGYLQKVWRPKELFDLVMVWIKFFHLEQLKIRILTNMYIFFGFLLRKQI